MYRNCIFCSADLGANDSIEHFPIGRSLAFDAARGRLWAVCPRCARWNLAPIEERWEAIEESERCFRDTRMRAQSENIGLARLADGTRLVRIGKALDGELAVWRYGNQLARRRSASRLPLLAAVPLAAAAVVIPVAAPALIPAMGLLGARGIFAEVERYRAAGRIAHHVAAEASPAGRDLYLSWRDLARVRTAVDAYGGLEIDLIPPDDPLAPVGTRMMVAGSEARAVLGKALLGINRGGAGPQELRNALAMIGQAGGPEAYVTREAGEQWSLGSEHVAHGEAFPTVRAIGRRIANPLSPAPARPRALPPLKQLYVTPTRAVALEMALHEETERRALEGELSALEEMWKQAEQIAAIADRLPDDVPPSEPPRMGRQSE